MGAFHYKLEIIPPEFRAEPSLSSVPRAEIDEGLSPWVDAATPSTEFVQHLRDLLPINQSWGETEEYVASDGSSSDLRIWRENGLIENIEFRFTPGVSPWSLVSRFLSIVAAESYLLVETRSGDVLLPDEQEVLARINKPSRPASIGAA